MPARKTKKKLINLSRQLGKIPSLGYAIIYLLLIPIFATVYYFLPNQFYHSTVQYEYSVSSEAKYIRQALYNEITDNLKQVSNDKNIVISGWELKPNLLYIHSLKATDDVVSFRISFILEKNSLNNREELLFDPLVKFPSYTRFDSTDSSETNLFDWKFLTIEELEPTSYDAPSKEQMVAALFPNNGSQFAANVHFIKIKPKLSVQIQAFASGTQGFPSGISGNYVRMFYLSASTITTLGYGDITPITTLSRLLVSIESICGIVLIGLFLNALSFERANKNEHQKTADELASTCEFDKP